MMPNIGVVALAALIPMIIGFIYYNPKVVGKAWMNASGMTDEKIKGGNMPVILIVSLLLSFMLAMFLFSMVVHQSGLFSLFAGEQGFGVEGSETMNDLNALMDRYGNRFRTFGHGAFHGTLAGLFVILPVLGTNALFERKGFKYIMINVVYWTITLALMGGILCQWA
jgi:hypothetical protein